MGDGRTWTGDGDDHDDHTSSLAAASFFRKYIYTRRLKFRKLVTWWWSRSNARLNDFNLYNLHLIYVHAGLHLREKI